MEWVTSPILKSLTFASLFQNISLTDKDLAKIQSTETMDYAELTPAKQRELKNHVFKSVEMLKDLPKFNEDAHKAVVHHHERPDGLGFPRGLTSSQIPPLCCVFIIASQFSHELIMKGSERQQIQEIIDGFEKLYCRGNFDKPFYEFKKLFYENQDDQA